MKKLFTLLMMLVLAMALAACSSDGGNAKAGEDKGKKSEEQAGKDEAAGEEEGIEGLVDPKSVENEYFKSVHALLKEEGYEVGELIAEDHTFFDAKQAVSIEIDGEDMLPLQIFDLDKDNKHLADAKKTGMGWATFDGQEGEIPVLVIDHYYFFINEGHPKQKEIYDLLEKKLK
ncbi:hypothetical protein [Bacillus sp. B-jedd]|uniref:hypothetical protein n=1 Tax=Bacillus sp. B-jedd TaxID=1476857 RepID=UPI0005155B56|nr:hypothetical protein [Bacillus sp. B-jedd]CEG29392.1 hypothetical protein BN1002_04330 [Bacillus sp. B-jedd]